jgi:succinate dehydrogenase / fumarate reductase, cytochrome b subunit
MRHAETPSLSEAFPMSIVNRPLSPHLEVYKPQLTSLMSIFNRLTGIALSLGTIFLVWQLLAAATGRQEFDFFQGLAHSWIGFIVLVGWSLSLFYHLLNGIRHLLWDMGWGFDLATTYKTGQIVAIGTVALTLIAWVVVLFVLGGK